VSGQIGRQVFVDEWGARFQSTLHICHGLQRFKVNHNIRQGIFGNVATFGEDDGERLASVPDFVFDQGYLGALMENHPRN
jgi:hypothetical protein